jgi:tellurite resistance protein TerC
VVRGVGNDHGRGGMIEVTTVGWAATIGAIAGLLVLDLVVSARRSHAIKFHEAAAWSVFYIAAALGFGIVFGVVAGWGFGAQYFAGYVVEKTLSIDNLFVFVVIVATFAVPAEQQPRALTIGIALALALRAVFIALGAALLDAFSFMFVIFGIALIATAAQLFRHRDQDPSVDDNLLVAAARRVLPLTDQYAGGQLTTRVGGRRMLTPLVLVLVAIGSTDVLFALDSIPAVFGVTRHAYIVFAANAFALLGLRALFFLVSGLLDRLIFLSTGLALILTFIGVKLIAHFAHDQNHAIPEISTAVSLAVIVVVLAVTTLASVITAKRNPQLRAHPGSLRRRQHHEDAAGGEPRHHRRPAADESAR